MNYYINKSNIILKKGKNFQMKSDLPRCSDFAKYVFGQGIEVQFGPRLERIQKHLLSMHKSCHYHMCSSAPFWQTRIVKDVLSWGMG